MFTYILLLRCNEMIKWTLESKHSILVYICSKLVYQCRLYLNIVRIILYKLSAYYCYLIPIINKVALSLFLSALFNSEVSKGLKRICCNNCISLQVDDNHISISINIYCHVLLSSYTYNIYNLPLPNSFSYRVGTGDALTQV